MIPHFCLTSWARNKGQCDLSLAQKSDFLYIFLGIAFPIDSAVKESICNSGASGDVGSIPGSGRSPRGQHDNPFQHSCLENFMGRGARWAIVHRVAKSQTRLKRLSTHTQVDTCNLKTPFYSSQGRTTERKSTCFGCLPLSGFPSLQVKEGIKPPRPHYHIL